MISFNLSSEKQLAIGLLLIRVITGLIIVKYGLDIFNKEQMNGYTQWLTELHFPLPSIMPYIGKLIELISGCLLILGLFVRPATIALISVMLVIIFIMGKGRIFNDEQLPFLLTLLFMVFFFIGGGKWSIDNFMLSKK